jgi:hypothetical protein
MASAAKDCTNFGQLTKSPTRRTVVCAQTNCSVAAPAAGSFHLLTNRKERFPCLPELLN